MSDLSHVPVLVPEGVDDVCDLPMGSLDSACNQLGCDVVDAVKGEIPGKKYAALSELCFQWAKITGAPKPDRQKYRDYKIGEIAHALGMDRVTEEPPDPTGSSSDSSDEQSESSSPTRSAATPTT